MNFAFILDANFLAYQILKRKMYHESKEITEIKKKLFLDNEPGFKKILGEEEFDFAVYVANNKEVKKLVDELISTNKFNCVYRHYNNFSKEVVAIKILNGSIKEDEELIVIKNNLWYKYMDAYKSIFNIEFSSFSNFMLDNDVKKIIQELKKTEEFKKMYVESNTYLVNIKKCWDENQRMVNEFLKRILRIDINIKLKVYISHPNTYTGYSFDNDKIAWGHYRGIEDVNYNIAYLVHEALHCLIPFSKDESDLECNIKHSIIELISDYELYSLLKGKSTLQEGHLYLREYKEFIYHYWLRYIGLNDYQISERIKNDFVNTLNNTSDVSFMNVYQFINFCVREYKKNLNKSANKKK